jgi:hypothetical protein
MHHLDISSIVKTLDDYFVISDPKSLTSIKGQKIDWGSDNSLVIGRQLKHGRLEVRIQGEDKEDNTLDVIYYRQGSTNGWEKKCDVHAEAFEIEPVRKAIREIFIYDANPPELEDSEED